MHSSILQMQKILLELDKSLMSGDVESLQVCLGQMRLICDNIEETFQDEIEYNIRKIEQYKSKYKYEHVNDVPFLIKVVTVTNAYSDDYLDNFVKVRSEQLEKALAIDAHNRFWMSHQTVHGNVFGSVPSELLRPASLEKLKSFGWKDVNVEVYDFGKDLERTMAFYEYCDIEFGKYVIVREMETKSYLVLKYNLE